MTIESYTRFLSKYGRYVLILTAAAMLFALAGIFRLKIDTDFDIFMPPDSSRFRALQRMSESFGDAGQLLALAEIGAGGDLSDLPRVARALEGIEGVHAAESPVPAGIVEMNAERRAVVLERMERISGGAALVEVDGTTYGVFRLRLTADADLKRVIAEARRVFESAGLVVTFSGEPYLEAEIFSYVLRIILTIPPIAVLLMLVVFRIRIGNVRATVLSLVPAVVGAAITLGSIGWIQGSVSVVSILVPIFVIVLGSADGLHVTSHIIDNLNEGADNRDAVSTTLKAVGVPIIMTTVTTMAGFLSLTIINSRAIRELGVSAAAGILLAGIATWLILPTILLHQKPLGKVDRRRQGTVYHALSRLRGTPSVIIAVATVGALLPGALSLRANFSMIDVYKPRTTVRKSIDTSVRVLGGSIPVYVTFDAENRFDPAVADAVLELQRKTAEAGLAGRSISAYGLIAGLWEEISGSPGYPRTRAAVSGAVAAIRSLNPEFLTSFFADDGTGRAVFFLRDLDDETLQQFEDTAKAVSEDSGVALEPVGSAFVMKEMNDQIIPQQLGSLALAAFLVFLITAVTQRSLLLGLASTVPIAITLVAMFGVMGYARIDLSIITGIMSGLTIGVGIDYAIHYVSLYRRAKQRGDVDPTETALRFVATPVLANAMGLAVGFTAMLLSPLQIHVTLSVLMWVTMSSSAFFSLTLLPTLIGGRSKGRDGTGRGDGDGDGG